MKKTGFLIPFLVYSILLTFIFVLIGCTHNERPDITNQFPDKAFLIPGVPFFPQKDQFCGPASLQSVFAYWGRSFNQEEISKEIFIPQLKGTLNFDLVNFAAVHGFLAETPAGTREELEGQIRQKHPVIAFLNLGNNLFPLGHYIVIIGYDLSKKEIIFHSGQNEFKRMSYPAFLNQWKSTDDWMLVVLPGV
ncbi:MAG: C39 family peptidase [Nitrospirae bacterium]|nr:C39 family peptidase [Nitrospirota bacterium]MBI3353176.1 C39 family peptidase [Nitrospirota bacterium]